MKHLGYLTTSQIMKARLPEITSHPDYHPLIALYDGKTVGMIGLIKSFYYERDGIYVRIAAIVVDKEYQNLGIGKALIKSAEQWTKTIEADVIALNSGDRPERSNAHKFYKKLGFAEKSIGFAKSLS
ncbi:GNAT family N-acetyltransferase [Salicibibacter kimchii]|uniref:GNAT family N-acetyltransferase n=2 Tax=Salicibibacter kimchii TaxID=2099786 RepID=A0A345C4A2_9BACI|nr:GNAT family N-acetyltransferase [Salicibibacter kimchii]